MSREHRAALRTERVGPPRALVPLAVVAVLFLVLPLVALLVRAPWADLGTILGQPAVAESLGLSLLSAGSATVLCIILGIPLAWCLVALSDAGHDAWHRVIRAFVLVPLVLPPVVGGVALLLLLGRRGLLGAPLAEVAGVTIPFTTVAVVIAQTFVALPFLVMAVEGALAGADRRLDDAAATLGASRWYTFRRVTVPLVAPGIVAGAVLAFARALGEFGATITFAGSLPGVTRTMPITAYLAMQNDPDAAIALSLLLMLVSIVILVALRGRWVGGSAS
ncbi:ABC transporter permease [Agromyces atrinae]|uniref:Molybdenum transport system permease n=1 Tax=Agromyces atrinae TaxID=592376 RepID=A0A4Q2M5W7_9MICO|nr:ABC transporter permease [Agromyces atrinae]NYD66995.1 molybdate transport system permease protein [Agromyces atrinae]RXZ85271.1 molybdate ABC transporter permease subunit [Agromyces atrinae]RXZ85379.1 molybdate ABC transporter permease subunit [Agromyces atrinae]